jgi:hypothetical protein
MLSGRALRGRDGRDTSCALSFEGSGYRYAPQRSLGGEHARRCLVVAFKDPANRKEFIHTSRLGETNSEFLRKTGDPHLEQRKAAAWPIACPAASAPQLTIARSSNSNGIAHKSRIVILKLAQIT